jgi:heme/copper-type cytochrome/quinol oxidase subunit 4
MSKSSPQASSKSNPWLGFAFLAPLTLVLFALSRSGLEGSLRGVTIMGVALIQAALAARLLLGVQQLHAALKCLLLLIVVFITLLLVMPTLQMFEGTARPIVEAAVVEETAEEPGSAPSLSEEATNDAVDLADEEEVP